MSVQESLGESLRGRWTKYIVASVLIHGAALSVPFPFMAPQMAGPIEVFILEDSGSSAPSGGIEKQERTRGKPRLEMRRPMVRKEARILPQETSRPMEQKAEPVQTATANIIVHEPATRNDPAGGIQLESGVTAGGGQEKKASLSGGSGTGAASGSGRGIGAGEEEKGSLSGGSGTGTANGSGQRTGAGETDAGFGTPSGPRFLHREIPEYPFLARKRKIEGKVVLSVVIDAAGRLAKAEVIEASDKAFADASLEALKRSTFLPARRNGRPVTSRAILPIRFSLTE